MIKKILNIIKNNVVVDTPYTKKIAIKLVAAISSTKKYWKLIFSPQLLHLPLRNKKENKGMLSNQLIWFLQEGQKDLPLTTPSSFGSRYIQTLEKLPQRLPKIKSTRYNTG